MAAGRLLHFPPGPLRDPGNLPSFLSIGVALQLFFALMGLALFRWLDRRPLSEFGFGFNAPARRVAAGGMLLYCVVMAGLVWGWAASGRATVYRGFIEPSLFIRLIVASALAGVYEEFLFRGYIFRTLGSYPRVWSYGISMLLFAAIHFTNPDDPFSIMRLAGLLSASFMFTLIYDLGGSIWPGVILHGWYDFLAAATFQNRHGLSWVVLYGDVRTLAMVVNIVTHPAVVVLALLLYRHRLTKNRGEALPVARHI